MRLYFGVKIQIQHVKFHSKDSGWPDTLSIINSTLKSNISSFKYIYIYLYIYIYMLLLDEELVKPFHKQDGCHSDFFYYVARTRK